MKEEKDDASENNKEIDITWCPVILVLKMMTVVMWHE